MNNPKGKLGSAQSDMDRLVKTIKALRDPHGCPWDGAQTRLSLRPYFLEEFCEVLDALDDDDDDALREELGDLLVHILFQVDIARRACRFDLQTVTRDATRKLRRRHPHVFAKRKRNLRIDTVERNWDDLKRAESGGRTAIKGLPRTLPSLAIVASYHASIGAVGIEMRTQPTKFIGDQVAAGEALLNLALAVCEQGINPEMALGDACRRLKQRLLRAERVAGMGLHNLDSNRARKAWGRAL